MLSGLRKKNRNLKQQLEKLNRDSELLLNETENYFKANSIMDSTLGSPMASSSRKRYGFDRSASPNSSGRHLLSDRAKLIRGEASKRIDDLLTDWRDYKERAEEEARRRSRTEQNLRELLARKERESEQLKFELTSLRSLTMEQKNEIDQLAVERDVEEKCRARCVDLELQISKMNRYIAEMHVEMKSRDEALRGIEAERESLVQMNAELRQTNLDQRNKLETCEQDVTETRKELEILEEMVRALNERKTLIFSNSNLDSRSATPNNDDQTITTRLFSTPKSSEVVRPPSPESTPVKSSELGEPIPLSLDSTVEESTKQLIVSGEKNVATKVAKVNKKSSSETSHTSNENGRHMSHRRSAMSALRALQKEHAEKCSNLAEHIQKLKEENKSKEEKINQLQTRNQKVAP